MPKVGWKQNEIQSYFGNFTRLRNIVLSNMSWFGAFMRVQHEIHLTWYRSRSNQISQSKKRFHQLVLVFQNCIDILQYALI